MRWKREKGQNKIFRISFSKIILPGTILLTLFVGFLVIHFNVFTIKSVDVISEKKGCTDSEQIKNSSNLLGQNFFLINSAKTEGELKKKFICIKSVATSRYFPNKVVLKIFGREPAAILMVEKSEEATNSGELENFSYMESTSSAEASPSASFNFSVKGPTENFVVDNEGIIYSNNIEQVNAPKVYVSGLNLTLGQKVKEELVNNVLKILQKVNIFGVGVKDAKIYPESILLLNGVPRIIFRLDDEQSSSANERSSSTNRIDTQIASLQLILDKAKIDDSSLEFIDLRFDKPVMRLAPKK